MNHATKAFFKSGHGIALAVYDTRRGQQEGREVEKILAFYPPTTPAATQSSIVGLAQALTMFAGTFNKECPFHSMEAHNHLWTMYHAEPDLWLLLVVGRGLVGPHCLASSLTGFLKGLHGVAVLLYGLISTRLQQDPSAQSVTNCLQPLLHEAGSSLVLTDQHHPAGLAMLSCPLGLTGGVPLLPISAAAFTSLQSLVNSLLVTRLFNTRPVQGVLVCWQTCLLWSSLSSVDTAALHSLVVRGIEPAVRQKHKNTGRRPTTTQQQQQQQQQRSARSSPEPQHQQQQQHLLGSSSSCLINPACWCCRSDGLITTVGPSAGSSSSSDHGSSSNSGVLPVSTLLPSRSAAPGDIPTPAAAAVDRRSAAAPSQQQQQQQSSSDGSTPTPPTIYLQSSCEQARLMAWHHGPLLLLLVLENNSHTVNNSAAVVSNLLDLIRGPGGVLSCYLSAELPAKHLWHVQGLRYLYQDHLAAAVRASPLRKVATLSQPSLHVTAATRKMAAAEAAAAADPTAPPLGQITTIPAAAAAAAAAGSSMFDSRNGSTAAGQWESFAAGGSDADLEVVIKSNNDCWVVARHTAAGRQLAAVVEGDRDKGLLGVMRRVQAYCDSEVPGVFEGLA